MFKPSTYLASFKIRRDTSPKSEDTYDCWLMNDSSVRIIYTTDNTTIGGILAEYPIQDPMFGPAIAQSNWKQELRELVYYYMRAEIISWEENGIISTDFPTLEDWYKNELPAFLEKRKG